MSKGSDKNKLILVIVIFALAAVVFAWQMGLFGGRGSAPTAAPTANPANPDNPGAPAPGEEPGNRRTPPQ